MKRLWKPFAALLAICLCGAPAGGLTVQAAAAPAAVAALYPAVPAKDIAVTVDARYRRLWDSFYGASKGIDWDNVRSLREYHAYSSYMPVKETGLVLGKNTAFALYEIPADSHDDMLALAARLQAGESLTKQMQPEVMYQGREPLYAAVLYDGNQKAAGEALLYYDEDVHSWFVAQYPYENGQGPRHDLVLDADLKRQLAASELDLEKTQARCLTIGKYGSGIFFDDGTHSYFMRLTRRQDIENLRTQCEREAEGESDSIYGLPWELPRLERGRLYPANMLVEDLRRMADGAWMIDTPSKAPANTAKPVIYLYPEERTEVSVKLRFDGELSYTYPDYGEGWNVVAYPDGRIVDPRDGSEHYYLFWDGISDADWSFDEGFCVKGSDMEAFLREKLPLMGLTAREYNDFITYWVPKTQGNAYNVVTFATEEYERIAGLEVTPTPDTVARIHMVYRSVDAPVTIAPQALTGFERKGFTVVEWGGTDATPRMK